MSKPLKVLIVEDSEDDATLITRELNKGGFDSNVTRVQTAADMKKALETEKWDIVLSDYRMPGFSGLQALEILKKSELDIPFILISGTVGESLAVEAMKAGSCDYVMKDKLDRLDVAIERELREARMRYERKLTEEALRQSEEKFRGLFVSSRDALMTLEPPSWTFTSGNPAMVEMFRAKSEEEFISYTPVDLSPEQQPDGSASSKKAGQMIETAMRGGSHFFEWTHKRINGEEFPATVLLTRIEIAGKRFLQATVRDITEQKQSEENLRQSEEKFRRVVETALEGVWFLDSEFKTTEVNDAVVRMLGYAPEELIGRPFIDLVFDEDRPMQVEEFQQRRRGISGQYERRIRCKNGSVKWLFLSAKAVMSAQGALVSTFAMITDITERKLNEEALRQSEARFRTLFEQAADIILQLEITPEGMPVIRDVNSATLRLLGYERDELIGRPVSILEAAPDASKVVNERRQNVLSGTGTTVFEARHRCKGGTIRDFECSVSEMQVGSKTFAVSFERDITERKKAGEKLRESEERFRAIFDNTGEGILVADMSTRKFLFGNQTISRMLGYTAGELANLSVNDIHPQKDLATVIDAFEKQARREIELAPDLPMLRKDGSVFYADVNSFPLSLEGKSCLVGVFHDTTMRRTMETEKEGLLGQLLQAQKMEAVGTLAGGVAHDFNNLLTAISGYTSLAMGKIDEADPVQRDLKQVSIAATKAAGVTRQLLLFSRKQHMEPVPVNLNDAISHLLKMLERLIGEDIVIETNLEKDIWSILGDEGNVEQVLMNLSVNARDAMPSGGKLFIKTGNVTIDEEYCRGCKGGRPGRFVCLSVSDTGTGMDELTLDHIFEPFFTTKGEGKGTGLGLSVVFGIVEQHKGWINVYSELGHGTTFKAYFPSSSARPEQKSKEDVPLVSLQGKGERIMVVEDQAEVRELAKEILTTNGYSVFPVSSAKEAIELFEKENGKFDLVFSDVVLTDTSGILLVEELLKRWKFRVLITSGYTDEKANWDLIKEKKYSFLHKPYTMHALLQAVKDVLDEKKES